MSSIKRKIKPAAAARRPQSNTNKIVGGLSLVFAILLIGLGLFTIFLVGQPQNAPQPIATQASVAQGLVKIAGTLYAPTNINQDGEIELAINTQSALTHGVQLFFQIKTETFGDVDVNAIPVNNLNIDYLEVERTANGWLVGVIAVPNPGEPFGTASYTPFLKLKFKPTTVGNIIFEFDANKSHAYIYNSQPLQDSLDINSLGNMVFTVPQGGNINTSPTPSPNTTVGDGGLNRTCNQYCADSRECAAGYNCWYNRCRHPLNIDSSSCTPPAAQIQQERAVSCNSACTTHADCAAGLVCHQQQCRLATNTGSTSCAAVTQPTISQIANQPTPTPQPKGGNENEQSDATATANITPVTSPIPSPTTQSTNNNNSQQSFWQQVLANLQSQGQSFALAMIVSGITLITLILMWLIVLRPSKQNKNRVMSQEEQAYMAQLQQRITELESDSHPEANPNTTSATLNASNTQLTETKTEFGSNSTSSTSQTHQPENQT